ncbi:hypothetical protein BHE97_14165 [Aeromicrobium sp. PE09-221]|uniref:DUF3093 domain-containing protein n=1 Tax=Aeromicrobium sp. PE09-221 TaxID=1898043 RepID=UPI000B73AD30|nr:DUF3093 domain-containing protein [Aeromicrobium sp. PE09-221]OUZ08355.1 hypothetical protein BHE97_14165 [Aeromicrobium sp. PE09-221]
MPPPTTVHRERLTVTAPWWVAVGIFAVIMGWLLWVAATPVIALVTAVGTLVVAGALVAFYGSVKIEADSDGLRAGRAFLDAAHIGTVEPLDAAAWRRAVGPEGDVRAFTLLRPYVRTGVRVTVDDPDDPTPFWLVSTRFPGSVARALHGIP